MLDAEDQALYVGKAKQLPKRVASYTRPDRLPYRLQRMIAHTVRMEFTTTETEAEALLLEANLIKKLQPRYNILLKDDKSFPYISLTLDHAFPRITKHRGKQKKGHEYYGPFASAGDVNKTINILQRIFLLRPCTDSYFAGRDRPCLEYQIKRCSAPCVGKISQTDYQKLIDQARDFLSGKSHALQKEFADAMEEASKRLAYEEAALYRDRIKALTSIQSTQQGHVQSVKDADGIGLYRSMGACCIQVLFYRAGQNFGTKAYFPSHTDGCSDAEIMEAFIGQFYQTHPAPKEIMLSHTIDNTDILEQALTDNNGYRVHLRLPQKGDKAKIINQAVSHAKEALAVYLNEQEKYGELLEGLGVLFEMRQAPERVEIYDNSHVMGTHEVGAMVVAGKEGFIKQAYRRFTIKSSGKQISHGDDFGMMKEVMKRRFTRLLKDCPDYEVMVWPDLLLIDGGKGQLNAVHDILEELDIQDVTVVAISKGKKRNAGRETFHRLGCKPFTLEPNSPLMHFMQNLRDEAHRFAIGAHRSKRAKALTRSVLDDIPGIGAKRKKALLSHFGSAKAVEQATVDELMKVEGVRRAVAQAIYDYLH